MNIDYVLLAILSISRIVFSRKLNRELTSTESKSGDDDSDNDSYYEKPYELKLDGNIRRHFAVEAALLDHKNDVVISPIGAMLTIGKMAYGAVKHTREEILEAIGISSRAKLRPQMKKIINELEYLPGVTLDMANSLFVSDKHDEIREEFIRKSNGTFGRSVQKINCRYSAQNINHWVRSNTDEQIESIRTSEQSCNKTSLIAISAVYFKGEWEKPFHRTSIKDFYSINGTKKRPMMIINDVFMYSRTNILKAQIAAIPYKHGKASFIVVLPYTKDGLPSMLSNLQDTPLLLTSELKIMKPREMILAIPKFNLTSEVDLKMLYGKVGVNKAMDPQDSDLVKIVHGETLYLTEAIQKTVIEVDEGDNHTENVHPIPVDLDQVIVFANHPFLFYITTDREQLFAGIYNGVRSVVDKENSFKIIPTSV